MQALFSPDFVPNTAFFPESSYFLARKHMFYLSSALQFFHRAAQDMPFLSQKTFNILYFSATAPCGLLPAKPTEKLKIFFASKNFFPHRSTCGILTTKLSNLDALRRKHYAVS
jgi:hypothetical protein